MPLSNLYISSHSDQWILNGSTTGSFGTWEDAGMSWENGNPEATPNFLVNQLDIFTDGVAGLHTGGLPRAYMLELIPQVPEGVVYPMDGWMSFSTLDLTISGHYGHLQNAGPLGDWDHYNETMIPYIGTDTYTNQYNPLWQTEFDPYHGTTPIQNVNGGNIIGAWSGSALSMSPVNYFQGVNAGFCWKYWNEATVKEYGDQSISNPYTSIDPSLWPCDPNNLTINTDCLPNMTYSGFHGTAVLDGQDAASMWDPRVSHIVAFNSNPLIYLGNDVPNVRTFPYSGTMAGNTGVPTSGSTSNRRTVGVANNKVIVIVVLKQNIIWDNDTVADLSSVINIDFDGNAFFMGNNHLVLDPGEPVEDENIEITDPGASDDGSVTTTTESTDTGADESFDPNDTWSEVLDGDIGTTSGTFSGTSDGFGIE